MYGFLKKRVSRATFGMIGFALVESKGVLTLKKVAFHSQS
jgi:hypothetical protein